ncbi:hypothetical protein N9391_01180 [Gammaproteobacteria bacterium]|nr:hypothetical protein [Gammaproteobacteria bacterium]
MAQSVAALNKAQEEANNASSSAQSENQTALEKRLKAFREENELIYERGRLAQEEVLAQGNLLEVLYSRSDSYERTLRRTTDLTDDQIKKAVDQFRRTERLRLEHEKLIKPAVKFAEAVEAAKGDAAALARIDINYAILQAAISAGGLREEMQEALKAAIALVEQAPQVAAAGARMAANMMGREGLPKEFGGTGSNTYLLDGNDRDKDKKKKKQPDRIGALARSLATEAEMLESWRSEGLLQIQDFNAKELELLGGHQAAVERLEQEHQNRLNTIEQTARQKKLSDTAGMFGALASIAETGGKKTAKAAATAQAIEGTVNAYGAAIKALNTPGISLAGRFTAYASVLAAGLKGVQSIKQAGGVSAGGSGGSGSIATPSAATEAAPQRVLVEGIGPNDLISGTQLSEIFDRLYEENENRGLVFQIAT